jgi:hypothetical protein
MPIDLIKPFLRIVQGMRTPSSASDGTPVSKGAI